MRMGRLRASAGLVAVGAVSIGALVAQQAASTGTSVFTDWSGEKAGTLHKIAITDLPAPNPAEAVSNFPRLVARPEGAMPVAPAGFKVTLYAGGEGGPAQQPGAFGQQRQQSGTFAYPRLMRMAPNGDLFLADTGGGTVFVMRGVGPDGKAATIEKFATGLENPFGIAFYPAVNPQYVYISTSTTVSRYPYKTGDLKASGPGEMIVPDIPGPRGHSTRDIAFTKDGKYMLISVGSESNVDDQDTHANEFHRADVLEFTPEGKFVEVYASGIRNCVGEAINPTTGELWCSTNERDNLGNHLVPDYVSSVPEHSFFGWPWYYMGGHHDPRLQDPCANGTGANPQLAKPLTADEAKDCKRVDLSSKVKTPDVILQPHMASLELTFYPDAGGQFPASYHGWAFAAEHGSWNRADRAGYEVVAIPTRGGKATGEYEDFLTGFVTEDGRVWGRPVGVAVAKDGSLFVSDDGSRSVWHVTYGGK